MIGKTVTQNRLTTQHQSSLSTSTYRSILKVEQTLFDIDPSYEQHTGYGGSYSNHPDTGYQSGENRRGEAQLNDRMCQFFLKSHQADST
jgi:hypothetical protein